MCVYFEIQIEQQESVLFTSFLLMVGGPVISSGIPVSSTSL